MKRNLGWDRNMSRQQDAYRGAMAAAVVVEVEEVVEVEVDMVHMEDTSGSADSGSGISHTLYLIRPAILWTVESFF
nr:hypothetical protein BaRGS_006932 [Batillaria attramentaria]